MSQVYYNIRRGQDSPVGGLARGRTVDRVQSVSKARYRSPQPSDSNGFAVM